MLPDLMTGGRFRSAVECRLAWVPDDPMTGDCYGSYLSRIGENVYRVCGPRVGSGPGEVVFHADGLPLVATGADPGTAGSVCGLGWLELTRLVTDESGGVPVEVEWTVVELSLQSAPLVAVGRGMRVRDRSRWGWTPIDRTSAWEDDEGNALYLVGARASMS